MKRWSSFFGVVCLTVAAVLAAACGGRDGSDTKTSNTPPASASGAQQPVSGSVTVFAAASLTDAFGEIFAEFEMQNPGVEITPQFAGSPALRTQLEQGARADIYASADLSQMQMALQNGIVRDAGKVFVRNSLVIITPKDNPAGVNEPVDLKKDNLKLVLAAPEVPVGNYARQSLSNMEKDAAFGAGFSDAVLRNLVSNESNVRQVVTKVQLGEADAGIVYGTDVTPAVASDLKVIEIPTNFNVIAEYPIALTKDAANATAAQALIDFIMGTAGQSILQKYGFQTGD